MTTDFDFLTKKTRCLISLFLAMALLGGSVFALDDESEKSIISIEQAQKSEYKKDAVNGGDSIVLSGDVRVSVSRGKTKTTICADKVNYNRSTEMLYAEGNVSLEQEGSKSGGETITASSLLFNTATLEGVFDNGRAVQVSSDAINLPSGSKLIVASDIFGRDSGGTIAFKSGELTFCDDENPHWRIKATRIWLLPGGEFAFFNALLFVGRVPLLYLPAFYYPKDELIFNPAFGFKQREGYYINTTTYLYGRKPLNAVSTASLHGSTDDDEEKDSKIDLFSFMNSGTLKKQRREGLVLHNLDEDFDGDSVNHFKIMGDYYVNLGAMAGFDGVFSPNDYITNLEANLELGFSNTIFSTSDSDGNLIYVSRNTSKEKVQDRSNFLGTRLPFRYQANFKMVLSKPFSLTLSLPIYSDPYFDYDFNTRAETMDWIDYFMTSSENSSSSSSTSTKTEVSEISSFTWSLSGSRSFKIPKPVSPFLSTFAVSTLSSSIVFSSKENEHVSNSDDASLYEKFLSGEKSFSDFSESEQKTLREILSSSEKKHYLSQYNADPSWAEYTPERKFYYPSQITPLKMTLKFAGTIFQYPSKDKTSSRKNSSLKLSVPEEIDETKTAENQEASESLGESEKSGGDEKTAEKIVLDQDALPLLDVPSFSRTTLDDFSYSLGYTLTPNFTSQISYSSSVLSGPSDFDWNEMQSTYFQIKTPFVLTSKADLKGGFISLTDSLTFEPVYQRHPYLNDDTSNGGYSESSIKSIKVSDYSAKKLDLTEKNALTFKPFRYTEHFSDTALTWNTTIKMLRTKYKTASDYDDESDYDVDNPEWKYLTTDLTDEECVTTHNLNLVLASSQFNKKVRQELSLTSTLPPQVDEYTGALTLTFPYVTFTVGSGIKRASSSDDSWVKEDFTQSLSVSMFSDKIKFTQNYVYDLEESNASSLKFALSGFGFQLAYTASYVQGYTFDYETDADGNISARNGWKADTKEKYTYTAESDGRISVSKSTVENKKFQPYQLSLAYTSPSVTIKKWKNRISIAPSLSTSVVYDFLRPTSSYFKFIPSLTFKINEFLDVTFSAESKNSVIYRYFGSKRDLYYGDVEYEKNVFKDLWNSFRFDSDEIRKSSGFKLQSLSLSVSHDLDDWDLNASFSIKPRLVTGSSKTYYDFSPYFALSVVWRPLASMKTEIVDEYGEWELNP